jgi:hypothetical protein
MAAGLKASPQFASGNAAIRQCFARSMYRSVGLKIRWRRARDRLLNSGAGCWMIRQHFDALRAARWQRLCANIE